MYRYTPVVGFITLKTKPYYEYCATFDHNVPLN